jgi:hypothetical protein
MTALELLDLLTTQAKVYRKDAGALVLTNKHMNEMNWDEQIDQRHIDAILVDFINHIAGRHGIDYALYTKDLI